MNKLYTLALLSIATLVKAQNGPTIDLKYLPVAGTSFYQKWGSDANFNNTYVPTGGVNQTWIYSAPNTPFNNATDSIYKIETFLISNLPTTSYNIIIPQSSIGVATHATYLRIPTKVGGPLFSDAGDSLWSFLRVDTSGVYNVGGYSPKYLYSNSPLDFTKKELLVPRSPNFASNPRKDTSIIKTSFLGNNVTITKYKEMTPYGYGTLKTPAGTFTNVLLVRELNTRIVQVGANIYPPTNSYSYYFLRNNTFGTSYLMWLQSDTVITPTTTINNGWYILPSAIGSISGTVTDTISGSTIPVNKGVAALYRKGSNLPKDDILATDTLDANGNYHFDSIPNGNYLIAIHPTLNAYPNAVTTYYGNVIVWMDASIINTLLPASSSLSANNNIYLQYGDTTKGTNSITGGVNAAFYVSGRVKGILSNKTIPGIGIRVKKNPGSETRQAQTNASGVFNISNLADGSYELIADVPGLQSDTCFFTVTGGNNLSFSSHTLDSTTVNNSCSYIVVTSINNVTRTSSANLTAQPNPFAGATTINVNTITKGNLNLYVYNALGAKVHTICASEKQAGNYSFEFSAQRLGLSAGIYYVKLTTVNTTEVLKLIEE
jgi:hypothetical protein